MRKLIFVFAAALISYSSVQAQSARQERHERNYEQCVQNQAGGQRVTRSEMRSIRDECRHRAAARTQRQDRRMAERREQQPVYVVPRRPLDRDRY